MGRGGQGTDTCRTHQRELCVGPSSMDHTLYMRRGRGPLVQSHRNADSPVTLHIPKGNRTKNNKNQWQRTGQVAGHRIGGRPGPDGTARWEVSYPTRVAELLGENRFLLVFEPHLAVLRIYSWLLHSGLTLRGAQGCRRLNLGQPHVRQVAHSQYHHLGPRDENSISLSGKDLALQSSLVLGGDLQLPGPIPMGC